MSAPLPEPHPEPFPTDEQTLRDLLGSLLTDGPGQAARGHGSNGTENGGATHGESAEEPGDVAARIERLAATGLSGADAATESRADVELLADLAASESEIAWAEGPGAPPADASGAATAPSAAVGAAARAAFEADVLAASAEVAPARERAGDASRSLRVLHARRPAPKAALVRAVAAVLVVGLGLAWLVRPRAAEAEPRLVLASIDRYALGGTGSVIEVAGRRDARPGERFAAGERELLALQLAAPEGEVGGRLVLRAGASAGVAAADQFRREPGAEGGALLRLESGEALLACEDVALPAPLALLLAPTLLNPSPLNPTPAGPLGLLVLTRGVAHVALPAGAERPAVALMDGARARFVPLGGAAVELRGPAHVLLSRDAPVVLGEPARALFRDLELFGGPLKARASEPFVDARVWRVVSGRALRGGEGLTLRAPAEPTGIGAAFGPPVPTAPATVLAWTPDPLSAHARVLRLLLRGPAGLVVTLPGVGGGIDAGPIPPVQGVTATLAAPAAGSEPGLVTLDLPLPKGWTAALTDGELRLALTWPRGSSSAGEVRFDGAFLGASPSSLHAVPAALDPAGAGSGEGR